MWKDVVIGQGEMGNSAILVQSFRKGSFAISQNSNAYWITDVFMGLGITVFKDTSEGQEIKERLEAKESGEHVKKWLKSLLLKHVEPDVLFERIDAEVALAEQRAEQRGRKQKLAEILAALRE
jgi:hypothetical protein